MEAMNDQAFCFESAFQICSMSCLDACGYSLNVPLFKHRSTSAVENTSALSNDTTDSCLITDENWPGARRIDLCVVPAS